MGLSAAERRSLAIVLGLLVLAGAARWVERPRPVLEDVPTLDLAALEEQSRAEKDGRGGSGGGSGARAGAGEGAGRGGRIDPNSATVGELQKLPGVGPAMAQRIVEERELGAFGSVADLRRVRGIGPALMEKLAEHVTLPAEPPAAPAPPAAVVSPPRAGAGAGGTDARPQADEARPVDLNRASANELQALPGVGPALAARLLARRDSLGAFRDWSDVDGVRGVGPALLARLMERAVLR